MKGRGKAQARPQRTQLDPQALLRELRKALDVARCIRLAAEYGEDDALDIADALAGLLTLLEKVAVLLDQPEVSS
ncbi:hypothetical protein [Peristeroidobacter soli]|uniref:hypothetical protein n=1 Tax=Peristeroidobacter soli TaxID=2497877 RepID=UPI00101DB2BC|nr:hypothetical protein [Peristeroidobacter soli]